MEILEVIDEYRKCDDPERKKQLRKEYRSSFIVFPGSPDDFYQAYGFTAIPYNLGDGINILYRELGTKVIKNHYDNFSIDSIIEEEVIGIVNAMTYVKNNRTTFSGLPVIKGN